MRQKINIDSRKGDIRNLRAFWGYLKPYKSSLAIVLLSLIVASAAVLSMGAGVRYLVDEGFSTDNAQALDEALKILAGIIILLASSTYCRFYFITKTGESVVADIRRDIFEHLIHMSPSFFETRKLGEIMSRLTTDTTILQVVIGSSLSVALRNILLLAGGITMLVLTSPALFGYISVMIPLIVLPIIILGKRVRRLSKASQDKVADIASATQETLSGIKTVQSYTREEIELKTFSDTVNAALNAATDRVKMRALLTAMVIMVAFGAIGILLWIGGHKVIEGSISAGDLSSFIFYSVIVASSFGAISEVIGDIQRAAGAAESLLELLNCESDIKEPQAPIYLPKEREKRSEIEFKNVSFNYPSKAEFKALKNISFRVKSGQTIALVGPSGAGKSTILQLLQRFYDSKEGQITIAGIDIKELSLKDLRSSFAYVSQDPVIFSDTVRANIAYGRQEASLSEVDAAAEQAQCSDFIGNMAQKFETFLGEKGVRVSGGERQRIAIARAILKDPTILLLDEATSALDSKNEQKVQKALEKLMENRTTIVIAHRLATILSADKIIVINNGEIEAMGTHKELLAKNSLYKKLAQMQFAD